MIGQDVYLGTWRLVPELSLYSVGTPPLEATYELRRDDVGVRVAIRWRMEAGSAEQAVAYGGPADGSPQPLPGPPAAPGSPDATTLTRVDPWTLDSALLSGETVLAYARRRASHDGSLLSVVQEALQPDGSRSRNFQVYRRA